MKGWTGDVATTDSLLCANNSALYASYKKVHVGGKPFFPCLPYMPSIVKLPR